MLNETLLFAKIYGPDHLYLGWTGSPDSHQCALYAAIQVCYLKVRSDNIWFLTASMLIKKEKK